MTYLNRSAWGARSVAPGTRLDLHRVEGLALHWPGDEVRRETVDAVKVALRAWQTMHIEVNGWRDIAYQAAVDQAGNHYRLRGLRYQSAANGDEDVNDRYGALLLVLGIGERPSAAMVATTRRLVVRHQSIFPRSKGTVPHSAIRPTATACPGDHVRKLITTGAFQ